MYRYEQDISFNLLSSSINAGGRPFFQFVYILHSPPVHQAPVPRRASALHADVVSRLVTHQSARRCGCRSTRVRRRPTLPPGAGSGDTKPSIAAQPAGHGASAGGAGLLVLASSSRTLRHTSSGSSGARHTNGYIPLHLVSINYPSPTPEPASAAAKSRARTRTHRRAHPGSSLRSGEVMSAHSHASARPSRSSSSEQK